ncbi:MAG TPA: BatA domain-containing protein [Kofleriaceae bacterium]|nr:BatA domain-containing protein [Kofleriaceae bacterium]
MGVALPWMLIGLGTLAVPVILHLVERRHQRGRPFPSVLFVKRVPARRERRKTLRDRPLLLLRCLALALLVLAFAGPFVPAPVDEKAAAAEAADRVFLLDVSASMNRPALWWQATAIVENGIEALGAGERAAIVAFDGRPALAAGLTEDTATLRAALAGIEPGHGGTDLAAAFNAAVRVLDAGGAASREVVLVTDLRANQAGGTPRLPANIGLELRPVAADTEPAIVVAHAELLPGAGGGRRVLAGRLTATGVDGPLPAVVEVRVDGYLAETREVDLAPGAETLVEVPLVIGGGETARITVDAAPAGPGVGGKFHLAEVPGVPVSVLLVDNGGAAGGGLYLERALALAASPAMALTRRFHGQLGAADLEGVDVVIVDDVDLAAGTAAEVLAGHAAAGGGLLVAVGERTAPWPEALTGVLPGRPGAVTTVDEHAGGIVLDLDHPLGRALGDVFHRAFLDVDVLRYRTLAVSDAAPVPARFGDGGAALVEGEAGRVMVLATALDPAWSSLVHDAAFAPLAIETMRYLADRPPVAPFVTVQQRVDLARHLRAVARAVNAPAGAGQGAVVVETPAGDNLTLGAGESVFAPGAPGFYPLHPLGGGAPAVLAANSDPRESTAPVLGESAFIDRIARPAPAATATDRAANDDAPPRRELWWWALAAALALFLAEALAGSRGAARPAVAGGGA